MRNSRTDFSSLYIKREVSSDDRDRELSSGVTVNTLLYQLRKVELLEKRVAQLEQDEGEPRWLIDTVLADTRERLELERFMAAFMTLSWVCHLVAEPT